MKPNYFFLYLCPIIVKPWRRDSELVGFLGGYVLWPQGLLNTSRVKLWETDPQPDTADDIASIWLQVCLLIKAVNRWVWEAL